MRRETRIIAIGCVTATILVAIVLFALFALITGQLDWWNWHDG